MLRVFYAVGPGDVVGSFRRWSNGTDVDTETSITFSSQFFDYCAMTGVESYVVSSHPSVEILKQGRITVENRPKHSSSGGVRWHLEQRRYCRSLVVSARAFAADVAIVDSGTAEWFMLSAFVSAGIPVIASMHNSLWPIGFRPTGLQQRIILDLNARFWRTRAAATICVSPECRRQITELVGKTRGPIIEYRAKFRLNHFSLINPPMPAAARPFRVLFAGRIEEAKGALDVLDIAARVERKRPGQCMWRICGSGSAEGALRQRIATLASASVEFLGRLPRDRLLEQYGWAQLVIVPTRSDFCEGLPLVAIEAVLAGRPVLTSRLSNALDVLGASIIEAQPNDLDSFSNALIHVLDDPSQFERSVCFPDDVRNSFFGTSGGLSDAVREAISVAVPGPGRPVG